MHIAAKVLKGKQVKPGFQLLIIPASKKIYMEAMADGTLKTLMDAGAQVLATSCGPCLGTGQGIPADGFRVISTANRNFKGRMGNKEAEIYLASPATVAISSIYGKITDPRGIEANDKFAFPKEQSTTIEISETDNRRLGNVWNYTDTDNLNTDQMFAGNLTYSVLSSDGKAIMPYLFSGFDPNFNKNVKADDIILAGDNFGCGSSREHPAVGLAYAGIKAVIVKSVNRIFYRSSVNQGLLVIVHPEAVNAYKAGDKVNVDIENGNILIGEKQFKFAPLPGKLKEIIEQKGLVNWIKNN
jgi:3-isopropylmalate dehydratase small subunit